jgi:hypothetical protein
MYSLDSNLLPAYGLALLAGCGLSSTKLAVSQLHVGRFPTDPRRHQRSRLLAALVALPECA